MKVSEAYPSTYLKAADLNGHQVKVTIDRVDSEVVGADTKPVVYFVGKEKGFVCNKTNANTIAAAYGDDMDDWKGADIILLEAMVDFQGKTVAALRVRIPPRKPMAPKAAPTPHRDQDDPRASLGNRQGLYDDEPSDQIPF